ncbi:MAG: alpha-amylase [Proteobacteria bacterium]|nr:alpha-amylase [Pseudomonadota bacterium]
MALMFSKPQNIIPVDKRLRLYNQYPGCYSNFQAMTQDLPRIKAMGFNQVWVNPFYENCKENTINPQKINCPYAMRDHHKLNAEYGDGFRDVQKYTNRAKELGLIPLFDLVARHVAIDHPFVKGEPKLLSAGIDTRTWFKRHPNGNFVIKGMDENYKPTSDDPWSDVVEFDYQDPKIRQEIFDYFWKPFIDFNIKNLGFLGARLDAVGQIPREAHEMLLPYIDKVCQQTHGRRAYLVAETVGLRYIDKDMVIKGLVTHTMNSAYWMPGPEGSEEYNYDLWKDDDNVFARGKKTLQAAAPTAGHAGSHDEPRYADLLKKKGITSQSHLRQRMLEQIMVSAFNSDGGHILAYGDEYGITDRVDLFHRKVIDVKNPQFDLSQEILEINTILRQLPAPTQFEWTQRVFCEKHPELVIFIVHQEKNKFEKSHIIIGNSLHKQGKEILLDQALLDEILTANGRNSRPQNFTGKLYLFPNIQPAPALNNEVMSSCKNERKTRKLASF